MYVWQVRSGTLSQHPMFASGDSAALWASASAAKQPGGDAAKSPYALFGGV